jgi:hypothetical protein
MEQVWETNNRALALNLSIKCSGKCLFRVSAQDSKPFSFYANRQIIVEGYRTITLSFPVTPKSLKIKVENIDNSKFEKSDFIVKIEEETLTTYDVKIDQETKQFLDLAVYFSQVCGFEKPNANGRIFQTKGGKFNIKYFPKIVDFRTGQVLNTPARIGHQTGIIEVSQASMIKYTIAQRMVILLHEFSHKYKNPKQGRDISDETGADLNALYIYLGLGFSKVDAIFVFANVFLKAQTPSNLTRMRKIMEYIKRFENGEFADKN